MPLRRLWMILTIALTGAVRAQVALAPPQITGVFVGSTNVAPLGVISLSPNTTQTYTFETAVAAADYGSYWVGGTPPGTVLFNAATGTLTLNITAPGSYTFMVGAENAAGWSSTYQVVFTVTGTSVNQAPGFTGNPGSLSAVVGQPGTFNVASYVTGTPTQYGGYWSGPSMPGNVGFDPIHGTLAFTPGAAAAGNTYTFMYGAGNAAGWSPTAGVTISVAAAAVPTITSARSVSATIGTPLTYAVTATNTPTQFGMYWGAGPPMGAFRFDPSSGVLTFTPAPADSAQTFTLMVGAGNSAGWSPTTEIALNVAPEVAPMITSDVSAKVPVVGTAFSYQIAASNNPTQFGMYWQGAAPAGNVSFNGTTGLFTYQPVAADASSVFILMNGAGNSAGWSPTAGLSIAPQLAPTNTATPVITSASSFTAHAGGAFTYQVTASESPAIFGYYWAGNAPDHFSLDAKSGLLSGVTASAGTYTLMVGAENANGWSPLVAVTMTVVSP